MRRTVALALLLSAVLAVPASAATPVTATVKGSMDHVWSVTMAVLKQLGWDIDKQDRTIGWITTDSRSVEGEDYGVYAKGLRHKLTLHLKADGNARTTVSVEREVFKRERILWMDNDEPVTAPGHEVEQSVLSAIQTSL